MSRPPVHLEIQRHRAHPVGVLRSTFRDPASGKIRHTQHGRIANVPLATLLNVQAALRGEVIRADSPEAFKVLGSKEFGAASALLALAKDIGLDTALYSKPQLAWVQDVLAMIVGRILYQGSKLALTHLWQQTCLWEPKPGGRAEIDCR